MSHVNAENTGASQIKSVASAGTAKMMDSTMGKMDMEPMMGGMGSMVKGGMGSLMNEGMGSMMKTPGVATGVAVYTGSSAGKNVIRKIFTHPAVLFGLGVIVGCCVYKYRKSIISTSGETQK
ncbi:MAG: hypothetical protein Q7U57_09070 [Methylovulum sp.]|nr:hypothetical protein [Methylovulum sp.]